MTVTTPSIYYANYGNGSSTGYFAIAVWHTSWTPTVGTITRQVSPTFANQRCFVCTTSGAVGGSEPTWVTTKGAKTTDGSAVWFECSGHPALNNDLTDTPLSSQNRSGAQAVGNIITNNTQDHYFICTTAGTTGSGEPTYSTTLGATTVDSGCTWTCIGPVSSFTTAWGAPWSSISNAGASGKMLTDGTGVLYVSSAHAETTAASLTIGTFSACQIICIQDGGTIPPTAANITTGATVTTTGSSHFISMTTINSEFNGISFSPTGGNQFGNSTGFQRFRNCAFPNGVGIQVTGANLIEFINTTIAVNTGITGASVGAGSFIWRDTPSALSAPGGWPTVSISFSTCSALVEGVDLSACAGTSLFASTGGSTARVVVNRCKLPSVTAANVQAAQAATIDFIDCDSGGNTYSTSRYTGGLIHATNTQVAATGGASDGTTSYSWSLIGPPAGSVSWLSFAECMPIYVWNAVTGTNRVVTIQAAYVSTSLPNNKQIWLDVRYFGTASSTFYSVASTAIATTLSTPTTWGSSATTWTAGSLPSRSNSHAYSAGDIIGVTSSGSVARAFVCTTAGTSSGSLPGAYASAGDGTTVTDGTATFTSINPFKLTVTLNSPQPAEAGYFACYINVGATLSTSYPTYFVDPLVTLS